MEIENKEIQKEIIIGDIPIGAATLSPIMFKRCMENEDFKIAFEQTCYRPDDSQDDLPEDKKDKTKSDFFTQYQVAITQFNPDEAQKIFKGNLIELAKSIDFANGIDFSEEKYEFEFIEDTWGSPCIDAFGKGWEVRINGLEVAQITHITRFAGIELEKPFMEFAIGVERLAIILHGKSIDEIQDISIFENMKSIVEKDRKAVINIIEKYISKGYPNKINRTIEFLITAYAFGVISEEQAANSTQLDNYRHKDKVKKHIDNAISCGDIMNVYIKLLHAINMFNILEHKYGSDINRNAFLGYFGKITNSLAKKYKEKFVKIKEIQKTICDFWKEKGYEVHEV